MEKLLDLNFCNLIYSEKDDDIEIEKELISKAFNINKKFFDVKIKKFKIKLVYSRKEFNDLWGSKTQDYASAFVRDGKIVSFGYFVFDKETRWKKDEFFKTLIHEMNHLFYTEIRNDEYDPLWLSEGLATFIQHNQEKFNYKDKLKIEKEVLEEGFENMTLNSYQIYTLFVEYLILNFGKEKLFKLIRGLSNKKMLDDLFIKIYNKNFDQLIEDGNRYQETP
jgi:hypothetical protein